MNWLKLLGFDVKKPLKCLWQLFNLFAPDLIEKEVENYLSKQLSDQRRFEIAICLGILAEQIKDKKDIDAAKNFVQILRGIHF